MSFHFSSRNDADGSYHVNYGGVRATTNYDSFDAACTSAGLASRTYGEAVVTRAGRRVARYVNGARK